MYYEYCGIRYAVPVRFRSPKPPPTHSDIYKANSSSVLCPQFPCTDPLAAFSDNEDCLVLNIFTPTTFNSTYPVMVFLHGGGFGVGTGSPVIYNPQFFLAHDVIIVTLNYRLNVYGFLNLGIRDAPGNAGLKDIRAALRWIQENISEFNGDPDNVTVFGQGSGGIAALYLTLSESTKGLCHKIISESGVLFSPHSFDSDPLKTASHVARSLEINTTNRKRLFDVYTNNTLLAIEEAISKQMNAQTVFVPSVEKIFDGEEAFLCDTPYNILSDTNNKAFNPVPLIIGLNTIEGLTSILDYNTMSSFTDRLKHGDNKVLDQRSLHVPEKDLEKFRSKIRETYFKDFDKESDIVSGFINLNSDFCYVGPMSLLADIYVNNSNIPVYRYIFNYIGDRNLGRILTNVSLEATTNTDELFYLFDSERFELALNEEDARMVNFMTTMWTNFAKTGDPTPDKENGQWFPHPDVLAIDMEPMYVEPLTPTRAQFWRESYLKYGAELPNFVSSI
ncbi:hypothetical protein ACJJTC_008681 [Scirpophaga incertulas]